MRDGIYKVFFEAGDCKGFNIVAASEGTIAGCDQTHFTTGTYQIKGNRVTADLHMTRHTKRVDFVEIADQDEIDITMNGICGAGVGQFDARVVGRSDIAIVATFQWLCEL
jgi:hypothetical protein